MVKEEYQGEKFEGELLTKCQFSLSAGNECEKILCNLESLQQQLPETQEPYLSALSALNNLNIMANLVDMSYIIFYSYIFQR